MSHHHHHHAASQESAQPPAAVQPPAEAQPAPEAQPTPPAEPTAAADPAPVPADGQQPPQADLQPAQAPAPTEPPAAAVPEPPAAESPAKATFGLADHARRYDAMLQTVSPEEFERQRLLEYDRVTLNLINGMSDEVKAAQDEWNTADKRAKELKKVFEGMRVELQELIQKREADRLKPPEKHLFNQGQPSPTHTTRAADHARDDVGVADGPPEPVKVVDPGAQPLPPAQQELWRQFPISRWVDLGFGLTKKDVEKLTSGELKDGPAFPIITVGDLNKFVTPYPDNPSFTRKLADLKGFGKAAVDRFSESETKFWAWWSKEGEALAIQEQQLLNKPAAAQPSLPIPETTDGAGGTEGSPGDELPGTVPGGNDATAPAVAEPGEARGLPD